MSGDNFDGLLPETISVVFCLAGERSIFVTQCQRLSGVLNYDEQAKVLIVSRSPHYFSLMKFWLSKAVSA